ncbi:MAG: PHP domain-containing protein [Candidatus Anstonellaceae archaeon]
MKGKQGAAFRADFHMHTHYSIDSLSKPKDVLDAAVKRGLSAIAITDHDEISGAFEARTIAAEEQLPLQVVVGEEVSTDEGDLLTYFLKRRIKPGPLAEALAEVKKQGAICSAAHPYDFIRHGIKIEQLAPSLLAKIDAIEAFNARITVPSHNARALAFAVSHGKPVLAGSDAHHPSEVGAAFVEFSGIKKLDANNILSAQRTLSGNLSPKYVHAFSRYAVLRKKLFRLAKR